MMDTRGVRSAILMAIFVASLAGACSCDPQVPPTWPSAAAHAAQFAPQARIVVLDIASGHLLAASHLPEAARTLAAPGSTLKPLVLYSLVASGRWDPSRRIADPMDARQALTWSCNTYFAALAGALAPGQLRAPLAPTGLLSQTGLAPAEAIAVFHDPQTPDATRLALLGVDGVLVTPLELATAYRWLAVRLAAPHPEGTGRPPASAAAQVVRDGLQDSASFGMAGAASLGGVPIAGKTGTASPASGGQSHGWFVGLAPSDAPHAIIVVYLPAGHGADAARVAADLLAHCPLRQPQP